MRSRRRRALARSRAILAGATLAACLSSCGGSSRPNVLLVSVDTLRMDHCSAYGYARDTTPGLRRLAEEGVRFERAYAPSATTAPSHAALFTSTYAATHGVVKNGVPLAPSLPTLAERLAASGYQTAGSVSSFVLHRKFGFRRGFERYHDAFSASASSMSPTWWEGFEVMGAFDRPAALTTDWALAWLDGERDPDRPFFLFVHYFDPHAPYRPPEAYAARFPALPDEDPLDAAIRLYDGEIAYTDAEIARLLAGLADAGVEDDTLVVVSADHGEGLRDHGITRHGPDLYEEAVRVPLIARWPGRFAPGRVVAGPVSLLDVAPTVLELVGAEPLARDGPGQSFAGALQGGASPDASRPLFLQRRHYTSGQVEGRRVRGDMFAAVAEGWKYIVAPEQGTRELYDLASDPGERESRFYSARDRAEALQREIDRWRARAGTPAPVPALDPADRVGLEALGYIE